MRQDAISQGEYSSGERRESRGLRFKLMLVFTVSLMLVLTAAAVFVALRIGRITNNEMQRTAIDLAEGIADSVQTFGQIGDMAGLSIYLKNVAERGAVKSLHVVRSPAVIQDFNEREGAAPQNDVEKQVLTTGKPSLVSNQAAHTISYVMPSLAAESCLGCHNVPKGAVLGVTSVEIATDTNDRALASLNMNLAAVFGGAVLLELLLFFVLLTKTFVKPIHMAVDRLGGGARRIEETSVDVTSISRELSQAADEEAESIEKTSASLEEMASMTRHNVEHSARARTLAGEARNAAEQGRQAMNRLADAINKIQNSTIQTAQVVKTIEEIAFQTNLLALNAAVEAARAGDAGRGFAIVAEEVRNLAQRSAEAARNTAALIQDSQRDARHGVNVSTEASSMLENIDGHVKNVAQLINEVATATEQQAGGIDQINQAVSALQNTTRAIAATAQRAVEVGENLSHEALGLDVIADDFAQFVGANHANGQRPMLTGPEEDG